MKTLEDFKAFYSSNFAPRVVETGRNKWKMLLFNIGILIGALIVIFILIVLSGSILIMFDIEENNATGIVIVLGTFLLIFAVLYGMFLMMRGAVKGGSSNRRDNRYNSILKFINENLEYEKYGFLDLESIRKSNLFSEEVNERNCINYCYGIVNDKEVEFAETKVINYSFSKTIGVRRSIPIFEGLFFILQFDKRLITEQITKYVKSTDKNFKATILSIDILKDSIVSLQNMIGKEILFSVQNDVLYIGVPYKSTKIRNQTLLEAELTRYFQIVNTVINMPEQLEAGLRKMS